MKKNVQEDFNGEVTEADEAKKKVSETSLTFSNYIL